MCLKKENYTSIGLLCLYFILIFPNLIFSQSNCKLRVASEPVPSTLTKNVTAATQDNSVSAFTEWKNLDQSSIDDGIYTELAFTKQGISRPILFNNLNLNIPDGAKINSITVTLFGRTEGQGFIKDYSIRLRSGGTVSDNFSGNGYNAMNVWSKSQSDKKWSYGFQTNWGVNWTSAQLNSPSFGVEIQLINILNKEVKAFIDFAKIEVNFTPLSTFCLTDCFTIYTDPYPNAAYYNWTFPNGYEVISKSEESNIQDLKVMKAGEGVGNICMEVISNSGTIIDQCCRSIRLRSCVPSKLGNFVWNDKNYNGLQDAGETGISGVKVTLFKADNTQVQQVTTNAQGNYTFTNIIEGEYYVTVDIPSTYLKTISVFTNELLNSNFIANTSRSATFFIPYNADITDLDFGLVKKLTLGDFVWEDSNGNGLQDAGEPGISNVKVSLIHASGDTIAMVNTDALGKYKFENFPASKYQLAFNSSPQFIPAIKLSTNPNNNSDINVNKKTDILNFEDISSDLSIDAGFFRYASVGDFVWKDNNYNGLQDETGAEGIKIYLLDLTNLIIDSTVSNSSGFYIFDQLTPGEYFVKAILPESTEPTIFGLTNGSVLKQTGNEAVTGNFSLSSNQNLNTIDLGFVELKSAICGLTWFDFDNDGQYRSIEEETAPFIVVTLYDNSFNIISTQITDSDGKYCFNDLRKGKYFISMQIPDELQFTDPDLGSDLTDSDILDRIDLGFTQAIDLAAGDTINNVYGGISLRSNIGDFVWNDMNYNGLQDSNEEGIEGILVTLLDENNQEIDVALTNPEGKYQFSNIIKGNYKIKIEIPEIYLSTKFESSLIANSDINDSGVTDLFPVNAGQDRMDIDAGLILKLSLGDFVWEDENGNGIQDFGETGIPDAEVLLINEDGLIVATTLTDSDGNYSFSNIASSKYIIEFRLPSEYSATSPFIGNADMDSDIGVNNQTSLLDFNSKTIDFSIDAGFFKSACIGDFVWFDSNEDGVQDFNESGLDQVRLQLFDENDVLIDVFNTGPDGGYEFCALAPGNYYIRATPLNNYLPTIAVGGSVLIDFGSGNFRTNLINVTSGVYIANIDLGFIRRSQANLCGFVWKDKNGDGILDGDEELLPNQRVELLDESQIIVKSITTNELGYYCFEGVEEGNYFVKFYISDSLQFTIPNVGDDNFDSDAIGNVESAVTDLINLSAGNNISNIHAGVTSRSVIGDLVWFDVDKNGLYDATEVAIPGINVDLYDESGVLISSVSTDLNGYKFFNVPKGRYRLQFAQNQALGFTFKDVDEDLGSDALENGSTEIFEVLPNENYLNYDAGYALRGAGVSGETWRDINKDSIRNEVDIDLSDVKVDLYSADGSFVGSTFTDEEGSYIFYPVTEGQYFIVFDTISLNSYVATDPFHIYTDVTNEIQRGSTYILDLVDGIITSGVDGGYFDISSRISGMTWKDFNGNGLKDENDQGLDSVIVNLINVDGDILATLITDGTGDFEFDNLLPGKYFLIYENMRTSYSPTLQNVGNDPLINSAINAQGSTDTIILEACQSITSFAGFRASSVISGIVFLDENENGLNDQILTGIEDVIICIVDVNGDFIAFDTSKLVSNVSRYNFMNLPVGKYKLKVRRPLFYTFTTKDVNGNANDNQDSDVSSSTSLIALSDEFQLLENQTKKLDIGLIFRVPMESNIRGKVWHEEIADGLRNSTEVLQENIEMFLYKEDGTLVKSTNTNTSGAYAFTNLSEGFYYVKGTFPDEKTTTFYNEGMDRTIDNDFGTFNGKFTTQTFYLGIVSDTNDLDLGIFFNTRIGDFVWDDLDNNGVQDAGEPGLSDVNIKVRRDTDGKIITSTTTSSSGNYIIEDIPSFNYRIEFDIPAGYTTAIPDNTADNIDSDIDENGHTSYLNFGSATDLTQDAGFVKLGNIGDRVWVDFNANGLQNSGEPGLNGVVIKLFDEAGSLIATDITSNNVDGDPGYYLFENIKPSKYYITAGIPQDYLITRKNTTNLDLNSDIDLTGKSEVFELIPGENKLDIDAGIYLPGCIGNRVWLDNDKNGIQDEGEPGLENIQIVLFRGSGVPVDTTFTDENGLYIFNNLTQGLYYAKFFVSEPYFFTLMDKGDDESKDSDASELSDGLTPSISLAHGAKYFDLDAGVFFSTINIALKTPIAELKSDKVRIEIRPNPAINDLMLELPFEQSQISIFDKNGSLILALKTNEKKVMLDLRNFEAGQYLLNCTDGKSVQTISFLKVD